MMKIYRLTYTVLLAVMLVGGNTTMTAQVVIRGNVYGGGNLADVKTNTEVNMGGGTVEKNVYGGGNVGSVGTYNTSADMKTFTFTANTGTCNVNIYNGTIGTGVAMSADGTFADGNVYGAGKGEADTYWCEKAMIYKTNVIINAGTVNGTVYGGGQIGRVENNATVTIGVATPADNTVTPTIAGNVFGAGAGLKTHGYSALLRGNTEVTIQGYAQVGLSVYGGGEKASVGRFKIVGGLPSEPQDGGTCKVTVKGNAKIGTTGTDHNVFGSCQGVAAPISFTAYDPAYKSMQTAENAPNDANAWEYVENTGQKYIWEYYPTLDAYKGFLNTLALASHTDVEIGESASVYGSVYGGGQRGITLGNVDVDITGGTVYQDVYGGGALADTNKGNQTAEKYDEATVTEGVTVVTGMYTRSGDAEPYTYTEITTPDTKAASGTTYYTRASQSSINTTTVNLTGGLIKGDAYGGGLGQKNGFNGASSDIAAVVWGDINVNLGSSSSLTATAFYLSKYGAPHADVVKSGRVFGCNNLMGSPQGNVTVTVYRTVRSKDNEGNDIARTAITRNDEGEITSVGTPHIYDLAAVYGGGNLADYTTSGKKASVIIYSCDASIESVYGGGNAAEVPGTDVLVRGAWEIEEVFGGGNGKDPYTTDGGTNWVSNPGANIGNLTTPGNANTLLTGGLIHAAYGGSNEKGTIYGNVQIDVGTGGECTLDVEKMVGAGKNADVNGNLVMILGCKPSTKIPVLYAGADQANVNGNVELTITSGNYGKVFGGNNLSGAIKGHIKLNIEETGSCETPIIIDKLYLGGNEAAYSRFGYYVKTTTSELEENPGKGDTDEEAVLTSGKLTFMPRKSADDPHLPVKSYSYDETEGWSWTVYTGTGAGNIFTPYAQPELNIISCTRIDEVFGGGYGATAVMYCDPVVNINMIQGSKSSGVPAVMETLELPSTDNTQKLGIIGDVYGGGDAAAVYGNTTVNIGTATSVLVKSWSYDPETDVYTADSRPVLGAYIRGNVYGGGKLADVGYLDDDTKENDPNSVYHDTFVNIGAQEVTENNTTVWKSVATAITILGNVYGGGKGEADGNTFKCDKAMVVGNTNVRIGNGTVGTLDNNDKLVAGTGNVYGGGEIGRVERGSTVTIGFETGTSQPVIKGYVFGAGSGVNTHGYSALVRGDSEVTVQGNAKVGGSVYGGGETASVGRYNIRLPGDTEHTEVEIGEPYALISGGKSTVTVQGNAEIGPDDMKMTATDGPDDAGHVFGAGKGVLPYQNLGTEGAGRYYLDGSDIAWESYGDSNEEDYKKYMLTLALSDNTDVTIAGNAFVKGSVYGGSENGHVRTNTLVKIQGGQIGAGYDTSTEHSLPKYDEDDFINPAANSLATCAAWPYDKATTGKPYDMYATYYNEDDDEYYYDSKYEQSSKGGAGAAHANDGHTFYGNVFAGGSGYYPYAPGKWLESAGSVGGNTVLNITGGHILSNVYGGNEQTNVEGSCTITMSGGTIGVPRTKEKVQDHPVVGNLFGAGKGDKRVLFNTWTNVASTSITITGGIVYGSVFGGGEDGHVMGNATTLIQEATGKTITIGSTGESGADGNVFGGGRGSETALTAGVVGGNVSLTINSGTIKGSVYGGGRLASVGTNFVNPYQTDGSGNIVTDQQTGLPVPHPDYGKLQSPDADHGNITININNGTIGNANSTGISGNIYGGSKGTTTDFQLGIVRSTTINMTNGTAYASVYGGGELAQVVGSHTTNGQALGTEINISGGTIGTAKANLPEGTTYSATYGNVYGGGKGNTTHVEAGLIKTNTKVSISQAESKTTLIRHNIYGGGAYGSVGEFNYDGTTGMPTGRKENTTGGKATIVIDGGTIGEDGHENGMIFGSSRGDIGAPGEVHDKLAWVYDTEVTVNDGQIKGSVYGGGENGHVYHDAAVNVHGGTIGISGEPNYAYRGNVYGAGCGTDKYYTDLTDVENPRDGNGNKYNPLAGIIYGDATVTIDGGHVVHNVYGAGAMGSVGTITNFDDLDDYKHDDETNDEHKSLYNFGLSWPYEFTYGNTGLTKVTIKGTAVIGVSGSTGGHVYGAARGSVDVGQTDITDQRYEEAKLANVRETQVVIGTEGGSGTTTTPTIYGSVYGGGEDGHVNQNASITIHHGTIAHSVFGGGKGTSTYETTLLDIANKGQEKTDSENVHSWTAGKVYGNTTITMNGGSVGYSIYGGGNMASVGKGNYAGGSDDYSTVGYGELPPSNALALWSNTNFMNTGLATVNIYGGTVGAANTTYEGLPTGNVFGSSRGVAALSCSFSPRYKYVPDFFLGYVNQTSVTIGDDTHTPPTIYGSVYGGGENGHVRRSTQVTINKGTIGVENDVSENKLDRGNVFGAGSGVGKNSANAYNTSSGSVTCTTTVTVNNGTIYQNVYGGGAQGSVGPPPGGITADETNSESSAHKTYTKVVINGGNIGSANNAAGYGGYVFGASRGNADLNTAVYATDVWSMVNVNGGTINGSVFGGGENGIVKCGVDVNITGGTIVKDVYGGGALADTQTSNWNATGGTNGEGDWATGMVVNGKTTYKTTVNLLGGTINDAYGGGLGQKVGDVNGGTRDVEATVYGDIQLNLNGLETADYVSAIHSTLVTDVDNTAGTYYLANNGCLVTGNVFGCNNINGTPKGHAKVHVFKTVNSTKSSSTPVDERTIYDVAAVFGGGNASDYVPADETQSTEVIIEGCDLTSIEEVYGGGYGAAVPGTNVLIKGTYIINNVFGGGYGAGSSNPEDANYNPGANVGYLTSGAAYSSGEGKAVVQLMAGTVNYVYGGSNTKGDIRGGSSITTVEKTNEPGCCADLSVKEIYGGGKSADMEGGAEIVLGCMPDDWIGEIYAGAQQADIGHDVSLTITSGKFERVFGGNNVSGNISGYVEVNIEENPECSTPIIIGELYGGGNMASYTIDEAYTRNNPNYPSPRVNVRSFTSIGTIYGGGLGTGAVVNANPMVNINVGMVRGGGQNYAGADKAGTLDVKLYPHVKNKIGVIGNVFGGGNAAQVNGNTYVNIGVDEYVKLDGIIAGETNVAGYYTRSRENESSPWVYTLVEPEVPETEVIAVSGTIYYLKVEGADIRGNVYGGGNEANVTGSTNVNIGKKEGN